MALFTIDPKQFQELKTELSALTQAVNDLSTNVGKWQGSQTAAIQAGLAGLIGAITGADVEAVQQQINEHATRINAAREKLQSSVERNQPKEEGE